MKKFLDENFLLENEFAVQLYHDYAKGQPIIDYHSHLSPKDLSNNRSFDNVSDAWLEGDHYKWRALRTMGVDELFITGDASPEEKFDKWAATVPYTLRNPLYHWTHLELKRYFNVNELLNSNSAETIYRQATEILQDGQHGCMDLGAQMKVEVICTTDDPADDLEFHQRMLQNNASVKVFPTFRPDKSYAIGNPKQYSQYIARLSAAAGQPINSFADLIDALMGRIKFFHDRGCRLSDHGLEEFYLPVAGLNPEKLFKRVMKGETPTSEEVKGFQQIVLDELCKAYSDNGWTQQFHIGAIRNNSTRMMKQLGPDTGFDSIGDYQHARALSLFLDKLDVDNKLAKTILYNLNPSDNEVFATMAGNYNDGSVAGKIQFGSGWWYLDQKDGMERQMNALSNMGLISQFVGMLTDSRSFLSFPRHEYFRRILCNLFGRDIANGELPHDMELIGEIVSNISYHNARRYFQFDEVNAHQLVS